MHVFLNISCTMLVFFQLGVTPSVGISRTCTTLHSVYLSECTNILYVLCNSSYCPFDSFTQCNIGICKPYVVYGLAKHISYTPLTFQYRPLTPDNQRCMDFQYPLGTSFIVIIFNCYYKLEWKYFVLALAASRLKITEEPDIYNRE